MICLISHTWRVKTADRFMRFNMLTLFIHWIFYSFPVEDRKINLQALWMIFPWVSTDFKSVRQEFIHSGFMLRMVAVWGPELQQLFKWYRLSQIAFTGVNTIKWACDMQPQLTWGHCSATLLSFVTSVGRVGVIVKKTQNHMILSTPD